MRQRLKNVYLGLIFSWIGLGLKRLLVEDSCWSLQSDLAAVSSVPLLRSRFGRSGLSTWGVDADGKGEPSPLTSLFKLSME